MMGQLDGRPKDIRELERWELALLVVALQAAAMMLDAVGAAANAPDGAGAAAGQLGAPRRQHEANSKWQIADG